MQKSVLAAERDAAHASVDDAASKLDAALAAEDVKMFMQELNRVIKQRGGFTAAARAARLNRTALYKIVSEEGNPALNTLVALLGPLGLRLSIKPIEDFVAGDATGAELKADAYAVSTDRVSLREE